MQPQVAVDPYTGTLVVSFLDTRNDAAGVRVAEPTSPPAPTAGHLRPPDLRQPHHRRYPLPGLPRHRRDHRQPVNLGPIPDNESSGNNNQETTFGFGQRQGLAVANGHIIPVWSSNQNAGQPASSTTQLPNIESAIVTFAAGPRVIASTRAPSASRATWSTPPARPTARRSPTRSSSPSIAASTRPRSRPTGDNPIGTSPLQVFYNNPSGTPAPVPLRVLTVTHDAYDRSTPSPSTPPATASAPTATSSGPRSGGRSRSRRPRRDATSQVPFIDTAVNAASPASRSPATATSADHGDDPGPGRHLPEGRLHRLADRPPDLPRRPGQHPVPALQRDDPGAGGRRRLRRQQHDLDPGHPRRAPRPDLHDQGRQQRAGREGLPLQRRQSQRLQLPGPAQQPGQRRPQRQPAGPERQRHPRRVARRQLQRAHRAQLAAADRARAARVDRPRVNDADGTVISSGPDNLVTNFDPNSINVTFDRTMQVSSFTPRRSSR